jgi:hypothetical protein
MYHQRREGGRMGGRGIVPAGRSAHAISLLAPFQASQAAKKEKSTDESSQQQQQRYMKQSYQAPRIGGTDRQTVLGTAARGGGGGGGRSRKGSSTSVGMYVCPFVPPPVPLGCVETVVGHAQVSRSVGRSV